MNRQPNLNQHGVDLHDWWIEVGNAALVTERLAYQGSRLGAVRFAARRWRARTSAETSLVLLHPGCQPTRVWRAE